MNIDDILARAPIIPVIVIERLEDAVQLAQALVDGGLPVLEVTLRSEVAIQAVREIAESVSEACVGVGTVTRAEQFLEAANAGARFAVSPGLTDALADTAREIEMPFLPGAFTPSDVMRARELGFRTLKLFPAQQAGGIAMLKALQGPLPDVRFCPTGGIGAEDFVDFVALSNVACVGGSWVCPKDAVEQKDWRRITQLASDALDRLTHQAD